MKKFCLALLVFLLIGSSAFAFDILSYPPPVDGGNVMVDTGIGLTAYGSTYGKISIPPIFLNVEYALPVNVPISVGGFAAFYRYNYRVYGDSGWQYTFLAFGGRADWHWGFDINWLDLYSGMWIGYKVFSSNWVGGCYSSTAPSYGGFDFGFQVGAHFYFSNNIGLVLESGYPFALKAGVALKFGGNNGNQGATSSSAQQRNSRSANNARLNGTWVSDDNAITLKNGKFEMKSEGITFLKGTYTTNGRNLTLTMKRVYDAEGGKWHSFALLIALGAPKEDFIVTYAYSISDDGFYLFFDGERYVYKR